MIYDVDPDQLLLPFDGRPARRIRDMAHVPQALHSSAKTGGSDHWITPPEVITYVEERWGRIDLDGAARDDWAARAELYIAPEQDSLVSDWVAMAGGNDRHVFLNPPYTGVHRWVEKAYQESLRGLRVTLLINAITDTRAWHQRVMAGPQEVVLCEGRISFIAGEDVYKKDEETGRMVLSVRKGERGAPVKANAIIHYDGLVMGSPSWKVPTGKNLRTRT